MLVSGNALFAFVSTPIATADGRIFVAYEDFTHFDNGRDDYAVAELDPAHRRPDRRPVQGRHPDRRHHRLPDRARPPDLPGTIFRSWSAGNIAADPTDGNHLAVEWSDMRNSTLPAPANPYEAVTNSDMVVSQSFDAGRTGPRPWRSRCRATSSRAGAPTTPTALLRIGFFDRQYDRANHQYGYTLATEISAGSLSFSTPS